MRGAISKKRDSMLRSPEKAEGMERSKRARRRKLETGSKITAGKASGILVFIRGMGDLLESESSYSTRQKTAVTRGIETILWMRRCRNVLGDNRTGQLPDWTPGSRRQ